MAQRSDLSGKAQDVVDEIEKLIQAPYALFIVFDVSAESGVLADRAHILTGEPFSPKKVVFVSGQVAIDAVRHRTSKMTNSTGINVADPSVCAVVTNLNDEIVMVFSTSALPLKNTQIARAWYAALT
jgi:hypothetical protein